MKLLKLTLMVIIGLALYFAIKEHQYIDYDLQNADPPFGYRYTDYNWDKNRPEIDRDTNIILPKYKSLNLDSMKYETIEIHTDR